MIKRLFIVLFLLLTSDCFGATKYAINAGGNWSADGTWSTIAAKDETRVANTTIPTTSDNVVLDDWSGSVTIDHAYNCVCHDLDCTSCTNSLYNTSTLHFNGSVILGAGMTSSGSSYTKEFAFEGSTDETITCNGKGIPGSFTVNGTGKITLQDALTTSGSAICRLYFKKGTLDTNNRAVTVPIFDGSAAGTKTLTLGSTTLTVGTASGGGFSITSANTTLTTNTSTIILQTYASQNFNGAGLTNWNEVRFTAATPSISGANTIAILTKTGTASKTDSLTLYTNQTVTTTLDLDGNSSINRLLVTSDTLGTARTITITGATISGCSNVDFRDITFADNKVGNTDFSTITGGSGDCGGNSRTLGTGNLVFTTADDWYWYNSGAGTYNFSDYSHWYTATNGGGSQMASTRVVLPQDNAFFDADSVTGSTTVDQDMPRICKNLDFTGVDAMNFHYNNVNGQVLYGSLTLASNVSLTGGSGLNFEGRGNFTLTTSGKTVNCGSNGFNIYMIGGKLTLSDTCDLGGSTLFLYNGTFDADIYDITCSIFNGSGSNTRTLLMGSGTWTINRSGGGGNVWNMGTIINLTSTSVGETSTISFGTSSADPFTFTGGGLTYNNFSVVAGGTQVVTISGSNTFNTLTINAPKTVKFTDGTTTTVSSFVATGDASNAITLTGTSTAGWTISDSAGENRVYYCAISYSTATGGATWLAYTSNGNTDGGNNSGWKFTAPSGSVIAIF